MIKLYPPTSRGMSEMLNDLDSNPLGIYTPRARPPELIDDEGYYGSAQLDDDIKSIKETL